MTNNSVKTPQPKFTNDTTSSSHASHIPFPSHAFAFSYFFSPIHMSWAFPCRVPTSHRPLDIACNPSARHASCSSPAIFWYAQKACPFPSHPYTSIRGSNPDLCCQFPRECQSFARCRHRHVSAQHACTLVCDHRKMVLVVVAAAYAYASVEAAVEAADEGHMNECCRILGLANAPACCTL